MIVLQLKKSQYVIQQELFDTAQSFSIFVFF